MDTNDAAAKIGIHRKELTRFLRRVERGLGLPSNDHARRQFTDARLRSFASPIGRATIAGLEQPARTERWTSGSSRGLRSSL
jgi:hypothetical protein